MEKKEICIYIFIINVTLLFTISGGMIHVYIDYNVIVKIVMKRKLSIT